MASDAVLSEMAVLDWGVLAGVAVFAAAIFAVLSWVLIYHWRSYGFNQQMIRRMQLVYFVIGGLLLAAIIISLLMIAP